MDFAPKVALRFFEVSMMVVNFNEQVRLGIELGLLELASYDAVQANCMFQLALMVARIAVEPVSEEYKQQAAHELLRLIRRKRTANVVRLFCNNSIS